MEEYEDLHRRTTFKNFFLSHGLTSMALLAGKVAFGFRWLEESEIY